MQNTQLSPRGAVLFGTFAILCGVFPILIGLGVLTPSASEGAPTPGWVVVAAGLMFVLAGLDVILDYGIAGGPGADGDLKPGTPLAIRGMNLLLGMGIVGLMTAVTGWVAFGRGPQQFSSTITLPFYSSHNAASSELTGRLVFGTGAVLMAAMFVACGLVGVRRFVRACREVARDRERPLNY